MKPILILLATALTTFAAPKPNFVLIFTDDQRAITRRGVAFIKENKDNPFFLYLPYSMPHIPLYVPDDVRDPDPKRAYINTIEHIDTEVGRIFDTLRELELADDLREKNNLAKENPEIVQRLRQRMTELNANIAAEARPAWKKPR